MKKSDLKLLRERNQKAVMPSAPKKEDASDELTALFDDGTKLNAGGARSHAHRSGGQTPSPTPAVEQGSAPARDFNRRANSLDRDALPAGLFPGASKKLYDALYLRSRGAVKPGRTVRATKRDLAEWSGVRNRKTIDAHLRYLTACGLITRDWQLGQNEGYLFEVRLPEETGLVDRGGQTPRPPEGTDQKMDGGTDQKMESGGQTQAADFKATSAQPKTFIKTKDKTDDDEAFAPLVELFKQATTELTGKAPTPGERDRWREFGEIVVAELKIAAARTTVSNVPAFLTEHLRRRLWKKDKMQLEREAADAPEPKQGIDASKCHDCGGSGWHYPQGQERGVAKCRHVNLNRAE